MIKRPFLFGLGIGMIIGAVLLQLMLIGGRQSDLGKLSGPQGETKTYTQEEFDKRIAEDRDQIREELQKEAETQNNKKAAQQKAPESGSGNGAASSGQTTTKHAAQSAAQESKEEQRKIIVRIPPNTGLSDAAKLLEASGVISDQQSFIELMRSQSGKIRAGYFSFDGNMTLDKVKQIVTNTPLSPQAAEAELARSKKDG